MPLIHNPALLPFIKDRYQQHDIDALLQLLRQHNTLHFPALDNGLFPAAHTSQHNHYTGYRSIWVRDNIHIAHALYLNGEVATAVKNVQTLAQHFQQQRPRFEQIIAQPQLAHDVMQRPHIRFDGATLRDIDQKWAHAQNDALGYFVWFYCKLAREQVIALDDTTLELLMLFARYWQAIHYHRDEDSGHWEETRKISASSIGVVVAALTSLHECWPNALLDTLINQGTASLQHILPNECRQTAPHQFRSIDSALLFLIYPLNIVSEPIAEQIIHNVTTQLQGDYGIRRYLGDSYWSADYKTQLSAEARTADFSDNLSSRDALLKPGEEAQWCIFDPILSIIFGQRYLSSGNSHDLQQQTLYLNRSLGQISGPDCTLGAWLCPESYYLENGQYTPSDPTPLLWTQANLLQALLFMRRSCLRKT